MSEDSRIPALRRVYEDALVRMMRVRLDEKDPEARAIEVKVKVLGKFLEFLESGTPNERVQQVSTDSLLVFTVPEGLKPEELNTIFKVIDLTCPPTTKIIVMTGNLSLAAFSRKELLDKLPTPTIWRPESPYDANEMFRLQVHGEIISEPIIPNSQKAKEYANRMVNQMMEDRLGRKKP